MRTAGSGSAAARQEQRPQVPPTSSVPVRVLTTSSSPLPPASSSSGAPEAGSTDQAHTKKSSAACVQSQHSRQHRRGRGGGGAAGTLRSQLALHRAASLAAHNHSGSALCSHVSVHVHLQHHHLAPWPAAVHGCLQAGSIGSAWAGLPKLQAAPCSHATQISTHPVAAHGRQQVAQVRGPVIERAAKDGLAVALLQPAGWMGATTACAWAGGWRRLAAGGAAAAAWEQRGSSGRLRHRP